MASGSEMVKDNSAQIIRNGQRPPPNFRNLVEIETLIDDIGELSSIPPSLDYSRHQIMLSMQDWRNHRF